MVAQPLSSVGEVKVVDEEPLFLRTFAGFVTSTVNLVPVIDIFHPHLALMLCALQWKAVPDTSLLPGLRSRLGDLGLEHDVDNLTPYPRLAGQQLGVAEKVEATLCARKRNASPILIGEEANGVALV